MNLKNTLLSQSVQENFQESQLEDSDTYPSQQINSDLLISVIIPIYNEENSIKDVIERIPNHRNYEIILVDDGSTDNSLEKVKLIRNRQIKVVKHNINRGYGAAILTGIKSATGDIIVTMDSDGQHCPEEIPKLIQPILENKADLIIGSRYLGQCNYKVPFHTRFGESFIDFFLWFLFNQNVRNNQSGFRAFRMGHLNIFDDLIYDNFGFCTEIIFKSALNGLRIKEIAITVNPRKYGASYVRLLKIFMSISSCIFIYSLKKIRILNFIPQTISRRLSYKLIK